MKEHFAFEGPLIDRGEVVVGLDEVGRGALAGPLVVGAVVLSRLRPPPEGLNDSKALTPHQRERLVAPLYSWCDEWSIGEASAREIDAWGIRIALAVAATRALAGLVSTPTHALVDGSFNFLRVSTMLPGDDIPPLTFRDLRHTTVVKGDQRSATIAAASVLAKVTRDATMVSLHHECARYEWLSNKGYGTADHMDALRRFGPHVQHRTSWNLPQKVASDEGTKILGL